MSLVVRVCCPPCAGTVCSFSRAVIFAYIFFLSRAIHSFYLLGAHIFSLIFFFSPAGAGLGLLIQFVFAGDEGT